MKTKEEVSKLLRQCHLLLTELALGNLPTKEIVSVRAAVSKAYDLVESESPNLNEAPPKKIKG